MTRHAGQQASRKNLFTTRRHPVLRWGILTIGLASLGAGIGKVSEPTSQPNDPLSPANQLITITLAPDPALIPADQEPALAATLPEVEPAAENAPQGETIDVVVEKGTTLSKIFANLDLPAHELDQIIKLGNDTLKLTRLRPGESITFNLSDAHELQRLSYALGHDRTLHVVRGEDGTFKSEIEEHPLEYRQTLGSGTIRSSFYQAAVDAGLPPDMVLRLADIFGWKINFLTDIQEGDRFSILYETVYKDGKPVTTGDILAASFVNNGKLFQAVRYTDKEGNTTYYTPDGKSLKRGFLRYPVEFSRISSRFSNARMHPILHEVRAHKGVDFAAPTGTPIHAVADGKVSFQGWKGGYGKVVMIQHDGTYSTVYGHMSRFEPTLREGARVKQGQVIGYVGATGYATGPHLHYEFRINGVHRDPLSVALPEAQPIPANERARFLAESAQILAQMNRLEREAQTASIESRDEPPQR
ncbi:MAG: peptidoglycan DD-metalloendopeptidase family protein [Gammaproteobacteria bacterium]|nr:peptidoglycan DD-metalloendopeptidase family protein [Gammaproteobacteria bacterium]